MWPQRSLGEDPDSDCWGASAGHPRRNDCRDPPRTPAVSVSVMDRTLIALPLGTTDPGPGWNRRSALGSRGRSCRVRLPTRPTSPDPRPTTLPGLTRRAPRSASTGVRAADRLVPVRLHASASGAVFRAFEVHPGGTPSRSDGAAALDARRGGARIGESGVPPAPEPPPKT